MKKITSLCLIITTLLFTSCKKDMVTTNYTIGCLDHETSSTSNWEPFEEYMQSVAAYNKIVKFTNNSLEENDKEAVDYFTKEMKKVDIATACSFVGEGDYLLYGIAKSNQNYEIQILKSVKFTSEGIQ